MEERLGGRVEVGEVDGGSVIVTLPLEKEYSFIVASEVVKLYEAMNISV